MGCEPNNDVYEDGWVGKNLSITNISPHVDHQITNSALRYNSPLKALRLSVEKKNIGWAGNIAKELLGNYTVITLCLVIILGVIMLTVKMDIFSFGHLAS